MSSFRHKKDAKNPINKSKSTKKTRRENKAHFHTSITIMLILIKLTPAFKEEKKKPPQTAIQHFK